ncbi:TetR family transcriptional regulator [Micromonospora sp. WMMD961]|uniref:TetR family transcriptional regulator n=1 Tax=Micromonospora sp. WMMD961 TaxID=3016100 RepID=UPI002416AC8F|nr:TetR family transcriptional regulator [Micromonospora sp. WMMD961]MDG4783541.1 TetR family transcriptional regulator [Micromonospora sp. WMMD961]
MATPEGDFQRARRPEHKEQRREAILAAARLLGARDGVRSVSLTDIATEVGIHKSAILRYFETREEIYLHLTAAGWSSWSDAVRAELDGAHEVAPERLAAILATTLAERPLFCELLSHVSLNLERHVSAEAVHAFKLTGLAAVDDISAQAAGALPPLGQHGARDLVTTVTALAAALWQAAHPPETLAALYLRDPRLGHAVVDFAPRLERLTYAAILGLIAAADRR